MKTLSFIFLSIVLTLTSFAGNESGAKWEDFSQKQIISHLSESLNNTTVAVRVKGLVCESCGLGLRKKISKLDAIDTKRFKKGVEMDIYKMVITIAVKDGGVVSPEKLKQAIEDAGYEGVYLYQKQGGKVVSSNL